MRDEFQAQMLRRSGFSPHSILAAMSQNVSHAFHTLFNILRFPHRMLRKFGVLFAPSCLLSGIPRPNSSWKRMSAALRRQHFFSRLAGYAWHPWCRYVEWLHLTTFHLFHALSSSTADARGLPSRKLSPPPLVCRLEHTILCCNTT